jgi:hypothetical protein
MKTYVPLSIVLAATLAHNDASAATIPSSLQLIRGVQSTYVPGESLPFEVRLPAVTNLGAYNIDVVVEADNGVVGADFSFDMDATQPAIPGYVFPSTENFVKAANLDSPNRQRMTLTDFDLNGVDVLADKNDLVAIVVLHTSQHNPSPLRLSIDVSSLILDTPAIDPVPVAGFLAWRNAISQAEPHYLTPVPEPTGIDLILIGMLATAFRAVTRRPHSNDFQKTV